MLLFRTLILLLLAQGFYCAPLRAQDARWFHFAPNDRILSMVADGNNLWAHTADGLINFNTQSSKFDYFDKTNSQLGSEYIHGLARIGGGGTVVVVTYDLGLIQITDGEWTYFNSDNSPLPANDVISVSEDPQNGAWMITESLPKLIHYDGQEWTVLTVPDSGFTDLNQVVMVDHENRVWVGTESRLLSYEGTTWTDHTSALTTAGCFWLSVDYLYEDQQNRLWASVLGQLFRRDTLGNWQLIANGLNVSNMGEDATGEVWLTRNVDNSYQLMRYNETAETILPIDTTNSSIPFDTYASLYQAEEGSLWMGPYPGELTRYHDQDWQSFDLANSPMKARRTTDIARDAQGNMFLLNNHQIDWYDGTTWQQRMLPSSVSGDRMAVLSPDQLWVLDRSATTSALSMYFFGQWIRYDAGDIFAANSQLTDLGLDGNGALWVQEAQTLHRLTGNQWDHFDAQNSALPAGTTIAKIAPAQQGGIWWTDVAASHLYYFDGSELQSYPNPFPGENTSANIRLHAGTNGDVWLFNNHRLQHFDGTDFRLLAPYSTANWGSINALSSQNDTLIVSSGYEVLFYRDQAIAVFSPYNSPLRAGWPGEVLADPEGNLWITNLWAGKGGLSLYNPAGVTYSENNLTLALAPEPTATQYQLQAAPSQFSDLTELHYTLPVSGTVRLDLYDIGGRHISRLLDAHQAAGAHFHRLRAGSLKPGMYFVRLQQNGRNETQKIILLPD